MTRLSTLPIVPRRLAVPLRGVCTCYKLWTQSTLTAARKLYVNEGYKLVNQESHHSFGKDLVGETWQLVLTK